MGAGFRLNGFASASQIGAGSSTQFTKVDRYVVQFTAPVLSSGVAERAAESTYTVTGLSTGTVLTFSVTNPINANYTYRPRCSTADELVIAWGSLNGSTLGTGESTNRGTLLQFTF